MNRKQRDVAHNKDLLVDRVIEKIKRDLAADDATPLHELLYECVGEADLRGMIHED